MKGVVFTEFVEMVEDQFSPEIADKIIMQADLPSGGVYTSVGTYDHAEIVALVVELSRETGVSIPVLVSTFGKFLFGRFTVMYPHFFDAKSSVYDFVAQVENHIHVEVRKLYPDAELPKLTCEVEGDHMNVVYRSNRDMADLAEGLLHGCIAYFGESISIERQDGLEGGGTRFCLTRSN